MGPTSASAAKTQASGGPSRLPEALGYYNLGLRFAGSETWQFRSIAEPRLATLDARAALYADADPSNDPVIVGAGPEASAYCHYR